MNYRHIFHAGNICDTVKHATLALVLDYLRAKAAPYFILDTHAGVGRYDLTDPRAQKTAEAQHGILRLWDSVALTTLPVFAPYNAALRKLNSKTCEVYPGSPLLAEYFLRPDDRMTACELHPEDAEELKRNTYIYPNIHTHARDGYEALKAFLPPPEKRGLVLIDPPYEQPDEYDRLATHFISAYHRWPQGIYMLWYPIKERPAIWRFHEQLTASGIGKILNAEFIYQEETRHDRLNGSGLIIINPPWQLDKKLNELFTALHLALNTEHQAITIKWLSL
jgi:23S rRNA (adenine2030-N6)-methyltransferase